MSQPPYGQAADPYQNPQQSVGGITSASNVPGVPSPGAYPPPAAPASYGSPGQAGYGSPGQAGYGSPGQAGYGAPAPQSYSALPYGDPGAGAPHGAPPAPKSKTALIIATVVGVLAIGGIILAVVLINRLPEPDPVVTGDDAALNRLAQSCFDGEMSACDDLFFQSPVASTYEDYGNTCGGRIDEAEVDARYCVDIF